MRVRLLPRLARGRVDYQRLRMGGEGRWQQSTPPIVGQESVRTWRNASALAGRRERAETKLTKAARCGCEKPSRTDLAMGGEEGVYTSPMPLPSPRFHSSPEGDDVRVRRVAELVPARRQAGRQVGGGRG